MQCVCRYLLLQYISIYQFLFNLQKVLFFCLAFLTVEFISDYYDNWLGWTKEIPQKVQWEWLVSSNQRQRHKPWKHGGGTTVAKCIQMTCLCVSTFLSLHPYLFPNPCLHGSFPLLPRSLAASSSLSLSPFSVLVSWSATCHSVTPEGQASVSI